MIRAINYLLVCRVFIGVVECAFAREADTLHYTDARQLTLIGKSLAGGPFFHRLDTAAFPAMPPTVKRLLTHSAGLAISFRTNSTEIAAKWCTSSRGPGNNMTAIAFEGLDLYIKRGGKWQYAGVARPATNECNELYTCAKHEATTDGTHPDDLGFDRMLEKIRPAVVKILKKYGI
ncbi:SGNH/GDSL hydrolase family protein [Parapedobacter soli]|uniref:SGNH/GDSL hydrolase family protein n=1 Tax=Parapedobacter soli TaxID=416955 RepID=UPI0021C5EF32|nr:SGNH/GDSL hydrolase family protein [Parapedobacter soli]